MLIADAISRTIFERCLLLQESPSITKTGRRIKPQQSPSRQHWQIWKKVLDRVFHFALLLIWLAVASCPQSAAAASTQKGWMLEQTSEDSGRQQMYISDQAIRLKAKFLTLIIRAPKFSAIVFNDKNKRYVDLPYTQWSKRVKSSNLAIKKTASGEKIAGLQTVQYLRDTGKPHKKQKIWVSNQIPISRQLTDFVLNTLGLPTGLGLPVRMVSIYTDGRADKTELNTISCKNSKLPANIFDLPAGYKKVKYEMELLVDQGTDGMGGTEDLFAP